MVHGRLFETSSGIPILQAPKEDILADGTTCLRATHCQAAAPASTAASWSLSGSTEPIFRLGSMRWKIAGPGLSRSYPAESGVESATLSTPENTTGENRY